jgi:hypothetical protein
VIDRFHTQETRELQSNAELLELLASVFGLSFSTETHFRNPEFHK